MLTAEGEFGLIDISDLSIYPWPLFCNTRIRSFNRLCKYAEDINQIGAEKWQLLQDKYFSESGLSSLCENKTRLANAKRIVFESN